MASRKRRRPKAVLKPCPPACFYFFSVCKVGKQADVQCQGSGGLTLCDTFPINRVQLNDQCLPNFITTAPFLEQHSSRIINVTHNPNQPPTHIFFNRILSELSLLYQNLVTNTLYLYIHLSFFFFFQLSLPLLKYHSFSLYFLSCLCI